MGGRMSRNKGARGEREVIRLLQPIVDEVCDECGQPRLVLRRNASQRFAAKQYDIIGLPWMAMEIKFHENHSGREGWWRQTVQACMPGQIPILIYRKSNMPWIVRMRVPVSVVKGGVRVRMTVETDWSSFLVWFKQKLKIEMTRSHDENHIR